MTRKYCSLYWLLDFAIKFEQLQRFQTNEYFDLHENATTYMIGQYSTLELYFRITYSQRIELRRKSSMCKTDSM